MNKNTKARRALALKNYNQGQAITKFNFGNFTQEITIGKIARKSKKPKVAGRNSKQNDQNDGEVVGAY